MNDDDQLEKVRAIRQMGAQDWDDREKLKAFMSVFHPEVKEMFMKDYDQAQRQKEVERRRKMQEDIKRWNEEQRKLRDATIDRTAPLIIKALDEHKPSDSGRLTL